MNVKGVILAGFHVKDLDLKAMPQTITPAFYHIPCNKKDGHAYLWMHALDMTYDGNRVWPIKGKRFDQCFDEIATSERRPDLLVFTRKTYTFYVAKPSELLDTFPGQLTDVYDRLDSYRAKFYCRLDFDAWMLYVPDGYVHLVVLGGSGIPSGFGVDAQRKLTTYALSRGMFLGENSPKAFAGGASRSYRLPTDMRACHSAPKIAKFDVISRFEPLPDSPSNHARTRDLSGCASLNLFPFQEQMVRWALDRENGGMHIACALEWDTYAYVAKSGVRGGAIISSPGTGKTRWAAAMILMDRSMGIQGTTVYVAPSHLVSSVSAAFMDLIPNIYVCHDLLITSTVELIVISYKDYDEDMSRRHNCYRKEYTSSECYAHVSEADTGPLRRVIFDEFHECLGVKRSGLRAMNVINPPSRSIWFVSGTPRFSLMHALALLKNATPACLREVANSQTFWESVCFREDPTQMTENLAERGMVLLPVEYHIHWAQLSPAEKALYNALPQFFNVVSSQSRLSDDDELPDLPILSYAKSGTNLSREKMLLHFCSSVALLFTVDSDAASTIQRTVSAFTGLRFRDIVSGQRKKLRSLIKARSNGNDASAKWLRSFYDTLQTANMDSAAECPICLDDSIPLHDMWMLEPCAHQFCKACVDALPLRAPCPQCRKDIQSRVAIADAKKMLEPAAKRKKSGSQEVFGAKIDKLIDLLHEIESRDERALIRVNAVADVKLLHDILVGEGFSVGAFKTQDASSGLLNFRNGAVRHLIMTKTSGLDLQEANHEILFTPSDKYLTHKSMALMEDTQFFARCQRIGQTRQVHVHVMLTRDTIENKIYDTVMEGGLFKDGRVTDGMPGASSTDREPSEAGSSANLPDVQYLDDDDAGFSGRAEERSPIGDLDYIDGNSVVIDGQVVHLDD